MTAGEVQRTVKLLAMFLMDAWANDSTFVDDWLANTGLFDNEEDREIFVSYVRVVAKEGIL